MNFRTVFHCDTVDLLYLRFFRQANRLMHYQFFFQFLIQLTNQLVSMTYRNTQHFCEFIVSGNAAIWAGCYSAAQLAGIKVGWMSYSAPSAYKSYLDPWANLDYSNFFAGGAEVSNPKYPLQSYLDAGVALSVYNADTDPEMTYVLKYYPKLKAVCTNYPAKLLGRIGSEGL